MAEYNPLYYLGAGARGVYGAAASTADEAYRGLGSVIGGAVDAAARGWQGQPALPQAPPPTMNRGMIQRPNLSGPPTPLGDAAPTAQSLGGPAPYTMQQALADQASGFGRADFMPTETTPSLGRTPMTAAMGRATGIPKIYETRGLQGERSFYSEGASPFAGPAADNTTEWGRRNLAALANVQGAPTGGYGGGGYGSEYASGRGLSGQPTFTMARGAGGPDYSFANRMEQMALDRLGKAQYAGQRNASMDLLRGVPEARGRADLAYYGPQQFNQTQALEREKMNREAWMQQQRLGSQEAQNRYQYDSLGGLELEKQKRDQAVEQQRLGLATTAAQQKMQREPLMAMYTALNDPTMQAGVMARFGIDPKSDPERYNAQLSTVQKWLESQLGMPQPPALQLGG